MLVEPHFEAARVQIDVAGKKLQVLAKAADPEFVQHVGREIEKVNSRLAHYETIKKFKVLPAQFSIASGELTPTLKLKRKVVAQKYAREIDELFS